MNTKIILASVAVALMAAAVIGVAAAQFANQTAFATTANGQVEPPCVTGDFDDVSRDRVNSTTGEPYCYSNGTYVGPAYGADSGAQNGYCYGNGDGVGEQEQYQYRYGGMCGRFW
jgi:hypothetical protein